MAVRNAIKYFDSDKEFTRFAYVQRSLLILGVMIAGHLLYNFRFAHRDTSPMLLWAIDLFNGGGLLIWTLTGTIVKQIILDYQEQTFTVLYMTVFNDRKKFEVPFRMLTFTWNKEPTRHQPNKWLLKIYSKRRNVFSMATGTDGFSPETLEDLVKHLEQIKQEPG